MKLLNNLDLTRNQLLNVVVQNLAAAPATPPAGMFYYDTALGTLRGYNGTAWVNLDAAKATNIPLSALATDPLARANHTGTQTAATISDLATVVKAYKLSDFAAPTAAVAMNSQKITGLADPTAAQDAATKNYVDTQVQSAAAGIDAKPSVRAATTANITLSGTQTIDGVTLAAGDRVLVKNQTTASANGVYVVAAGAWTRATDADGAGELTPGAFWFVEEGTTQGKTQWRIENTGAITIGTTPITINQFGAAVGYTAGNGIDITGNAISVRPVAGGGVNVAAGGVSVDTAVVARKFGQLIGDGAATSYVVTHNLGNQRPHVDIWEVASNAQVFVDVVATTANAVTVTFATAPAANAYYVTVTG